MKIEGWRKLSEIPKESILWVSDKGTRLSVVTPFPDKHFIKKWKVYGELKSTGKILTNQTNIIINTSYKHTKTEALKIATTYMKTHPNG
jgi:hypothetical protein